MPELTGLFHNEQETLQGSTGLPCQLQWWKKNSDPLFKYKYQNHNENTLVQVKDLH